MGQYLTIGIATRIVADKERAEQLFHSAISTLVLSRLS